jgi:Ca2+-binding RTX toxin-like protein
MSTVRTYYPKPEAVEIENGKDESTATGNNLVINTRNEDVSVRTLVSDDPVSISTGTGNDTIIGGDSEFGNDNLDGKAGNDYLDGKAGNDIIAGSDGDDTLLGSAGDDSLDAGIGNDSLDAGIGNDNIFGADGNDTLSGGAGNDTIVGGDGDDVIEMGAGDSVAGLLGSDTFRLDLSQEYDASNAPIITDFESGDKISVSEQVDGALSYDMARRYS